jgi:hypothetical protein
LLFKKLYRQIEFNQNCSLQELCGEININVNTNLSCKFRNERIVVNKKLFSDFFPFNIAHLASLCFIAKSDPIVEKFGHLDFTIEIKEEIKISIYVILVCMLVMMIIAILILQIDLIIGSSLFTLIVLLVIKFVEYFGLSTFVHNWDQYIGSTSLDQKRM